MSVCEPIYACNWQEPPTMKPMARFPSDCDSSCMFPVVSSLSTGIVDPVMVAAVLHWPQLAGTFSENFL